MAMMPKRVKYRKAQRGSRSGTAWRGATVAFGQRIWREGSNREQQLLQARVRVACLDARSLKPRRLPEVILRELPASGA